MLQLSLYLGDEDLYEAHTMHVQLLFPWRPTVSPQHPSHMQEIPLKPYFIWASALKW